MLIAAAGRAAAAAVAAAEEEGAAAGHRTQSEGEGLENPESGERGLTEEEKRERRCATDARVRLWYWERHLRGSCMSRSVFAGVGRFELD